MGHVASLPPYLDVFYPLGTSSLDPTVNGQLPHALPRLHDAFQTGSLTILRGQSFFFPSKARSMGHPHVFLGDLPPSTLHHLHNKVTSETPGRPTSNLHQSPKE